MYLRVLEGAQRAQQRWLRARRLLIRLRSTLPRLLGTENLPLGSCSGPWHTARKYDAHPSRMPFHTIMWGHSSNI